MNTDYKCVTTVDGIKDYINGSLVVAFDFETAPDEMYRKDEKAALDPAKAHIVGCSFSVKEGTGIYVPIAHRIGTNIDRDAFFAFLTAFLMDKTIIKIAHNIAFESSMAYAKGIVIQPPVYDTICASQMSLKSAYEFRKLNESGLKRLAEELFGEPLPSFASVTDGKHFDELDAQDEETVRYGSADSDFALRLYYKFNSWFDRFLPKHRYIVEQIESPTAVYLGIMKKNGIPVNRPLMQERKSEAEAEMERIRKEIEFIIGDVNIGANCSTQAFKNYLYNDLKLPVLKTTATNREAADDMTMTLLKEWCDKNRPEMSKLFVLVQEYRKCGKIKSTYIDGYLKHLNSVTGRIHPDIFALSTDTGRMNCRNPNAQNMPRKSNDPIGIRSFIEAPDGHLILSLDFSQIELRVGAFYCRDEVMMDTYRKNGDIHAATTCVIFGISIEEAQDKHSKNYKERRTIAKNVNFGTFYGLFPKGLQKTLKFKAGIEKSVSECEEILYNLKHGYKGLTSWQEETKANAARRLYSETWLGRRRYLPGIKSDNWSQKSFAERCSLNTPIQGTAADILKLAIVRILAGLPEREWLKPILQIHDELTFIIPKDKLSEAVVFIKSCMEAQPFSEFDLPLIAEASAGKNFGMMEELEGCFMYENKSDLFRGGKRMSVTTSDVLGSIFNPFDMVCFRTFDDKKGGEFQGAKFQCECGKYKSIEDTLKKHNAMNRGVFFVVNCGGHDDSSITRINAQFVEMDEGSFDEQQKKIDAFPLAPSMVIKTQKSLHVYWLMDSTAKVERFRTIQTQLVKYFDGDPMCVNESRVMRLPGFNHCKKDTPVEVTCISFHPERKYTQDQLSEVLPEINLAPTEKKNGTEKGLYVVMLSCLFLQHCRDDAASLSEPDWYAMISNLASFYGGTKLIHTMSAPYPGYSEDNTQKKINHFLESGTKPINCQTICEKGFKCPKFESGECAVKSPAALCCKPLSTDVLRDILRDLPITGETIKDLQTAKQFVIDYLYNQDAVTADLMINLEICKHFNLQVSFLKSLNSVFKDVSRAYKASKSAKRARAGTAIPEWYEPTDNGLRFLPGELAKYMSETQQVLYAAEQHYNYRGGVYCEMSEMEAQRLVQENMLIREMKMSQIIDTEKQWRLMIRRDIRELNANPYIINVLNGLYNVLEDTLTEHTPNYYSTVQLNVTYDKKADCPLFKKFLEESMGGDMAQVGLIQEMLGYFLIPINSAQKCFVIVGVASAGKSVLLRVLNDVLLGKQNVSNVSWQALNERFKTAELFGKLANIFADLPTKNIDDNGIFKALVGEDYLTVEKKNKNPFSFQSSARLLFSCNNIPRNFGDRSEGFYRRLIIIRFNHAVPQEKRDPDLLEKFRMEADGIFLFALEGLRRLMNNHFVFSETQVNADELQQYREESDSALSFVKEYCELRADYSVGSTELFNAYKDYCEECGLKPYSQKNFVQQITAAFPDVTRDIDRKAKRRILMGIRLGEVLG